MLQDNDCCYVREVSGEALQLHAVYKRLYVLLQATQETVSGITSHVRASEHAMKSKVHNYDKIIITIVPRYTGRNITHLLPLAMLLMLCTHNSTDSNTFMIFSGIAWYYIVSAYF